MGEHYRDFTVTSRENKGKIKYLLCASDAVQQTRCQLELMVRGGQMKSAADRLQTLWKFRVMP